jgi:uncharacterized protein (DUF305 family)
MFETRSPRVRLIAGALAAILLLGLGFAGGWIYKQLDVPGDHSPEAGFARDMSLHHTQAVEMAMFAYRKGSSESVRTVGYDIATGQQFQIGQMQAWLEDWHLSPVPPDGKMAWMPDGPESLLPDGRMPGMASDEELNRLKAADGRDFDVLFLQLMVRHHLGGVHMAEEVVKLSDRDEVLGLARSMLRVQQGEINLMNKLLADLGATA